MTVRDAAPLLATAVATALLWLAIGTQPTLPEGPGGPVGWSGDFLAFYLPNAEYAGARLARGEIPLWNPHQGAGAPFLATLQPGVLYPPNWLHAVLPGQTAFVVLAALHVGLSALLAAALAVALGAGPLAAAVAGLAYASAQDLVGSIWTPPVHYAAAWAPGLLLAVDRVIERPSPRRAAALAAVLALSLLTGWPYVVAMSALGAALYGGALLVAGAVRARRAPLRPLCALALAVGAGLALAAPQLLPAGELVARSVRALGTLVEGQAVWVNEPHDPWLWLARLKHHGFGDGVPGLASLVLSGLALALAGRGRARFGALLGVGVLGLLVSFPRHAPLFGWLRELPLFGDFRFPYRYRLLLCLALAIGAGVGTDRVQRLLGRWPAAAHAAGAVALGICLFGSALPALRTVLPFARSVPQRPSLLRELEARGGVRSAGEFGRVYWAGRAEKLGWAPETYAVHDLEPITLARTAQLLSFFETGRPLTLATVARRPHSARAGRERLAAPFYGFLTFPRTGERAALLDFFSARWITGERAPPWLGHRYRRISAPGAELAVFENPGALPHAFRVPRAVREPADLRAAMRGMVSGLFDPRARVLLDRPPPHLLARPGEAFAPSSGTVRVERYQAERVVLRTSGERPALVVLTDAHFPGWQAAVDGEPAPLLRANLGFRAVAVPAGEHEVEMRYRPASFRWGLALAAVGAVVCAGAALWPAQTIRESRLPQ